MKKLIRKAKDMLMAAYIKIMNIISEASKKIVAILKTLKPW